MNLRTVCSEQDLAGSPAALLIQVAVGASRASGSRVDLKGGKTWGLNLDDKKAVVAEVSAQVANAQTIAVAEYRGIAVGDLTPRCVPRPASLAYTCAC